MSATPLIPGKLYRVCGAGIQIDMIARHGCDAICAAMAIVFASHGAEVGA